MIEDELIKSFLKMSYPIMKLKLDKLGYQSKKGKFKRVVVVNRINYKLSDPSQRYKAMYQLNTILAKVFHMDEDELIEFIKLHLHIT